MQEPPAPHHQAAHVDGEEAAPAEHSGGAVDEEHQGDHHDRVQALVLEADPVDRDDGAPGEREADEPADSHLGDEHGNQLHDRRVRLGQQLEEPEREEHRHGVVAPRLQF